METLQKVNTYYQKIIELILELYNDDLQKAIPGHCMKITGLGQNELELLWEELNEKYPKIDTYIIKNEPDDNHKYISPTKLIEYRNKQKAPLLVLIPSNSRTAAEDSYGNATFKEISLDGIEERLKKSLIKNVPDEYAAVVQNEIIAYLNTYGISTINIIKYLLALEERGYSSANIGNLIYMLNLIPDEYLIIEESKIRSRLSFNIDCINLLCLFSKPLYDRITELPIEVNTIQSDLVEFLKTENQARSSEEICKIIHSRYENLNFKNWPLDIPDPNIIKLSVEEIKSNDFREEDGRKVLYAIENSSSKVRIKISTNIPPNEISDLKYFKIILMAVDGGSGEEIAVLRKVKNSASSRSYREATVELNSNIIEEGSYFFKVLAEDDIGNILNSNDDFKDDKIQKAWLDALAKNSEADKSNFPYKLSCDSEDFDFIVDEEIDRGENQRKDKLNNVLQAFYKYRIDKIITRQEPDTPIPSENSNIWLTERNKYISTFHIHYSDKHNYQINISSKLRIIEDIFLKNSDSFGYIKCNLKANSTALGFDSIQYFPSDLTSIIPNPILRLREEIFNRIRTSNDTKDGIFETADIFNFFDKLKDYVKKLADWTTSLREQVSSDDLNTEERNIVQQFLTELQVLDSVKIRTRLPDGQPTEAILISPLHPLRLAWFMQLFEVFVEWEQKSHEYQGHSETWPKFLSYLFEGYLFPENNPLVIVDLNSYSSFQYVGEISYGWAFYLNVNQQEDKNRMTSVSRQMKHYYRQLFNITQDSNIDRDISQKLVIRHLSNYLSQHPYTDKLIINLFNAGDANVFADAFVEIEKDPAYKEIKYEIRIFKGEDRIIEHGEALRNLINPEYNVSEEAEAFSQPSKNRLFPKLRFSINEISEYLRYPSKFTAHLSFIISPFPITIELIKPYDSGRNFFLNGLITDSTVTIYENENEIKWNRYIQGNKLSLKYAGAGELGIKLFENIQSFISGALASRYTESIPSTQLRLSDRDKVLLTHLHDYSDWVITFDKNIGPQIFDQPSKDGKIPFLLDYIPGEEISEVSSYLTTRPTSEILGLLGPHFEEFDIDIHNPDHEKKITVLLEDLRAVSSSLVLQLNSSKNKAFEVIGSAFTKRVLEKKGFLEESFLIPIDLHQNLFDGLAIESKSRADNLLISIDPERREIKIVVIEIKCRKSLNESEANDLKNKIKMQIANTIEALRIHFDPEYSVSYDRLDREIKNIEMRSLFSFYIERALRYNFLSENAHASYLHFLQDLDLGYRISFQQLGLIFDFSAPQKHLKEIHSDDLIIFTFGGKLIEEILDPDSDLNTKRLEEPVLYEELNSIVGKDNPLKPFIKRFKAKVQHETRNDSTDSVYKKPESGSQNKPTEQKASIVPNIQDKRENESQLAKGNQETSDNHEFQPLKDHITPKFDLLIGKNSPSNQYGILGENLHGKTIALDLSETNTFSLFGVQGGGKSYTIGTISEMVLKQFNNINDLPSPLAGVIFHYSESMEYEPEFTSMIYPNDKESELKKLRERYGAEPNNIDDVIILTPKDKIEERKNEYPSIDILPIAFNSKELNVQDWLFLLGAVGNDSTYIKQLKAIMKEHRRNITLEGITRSVDETELLSNTQKALARQKLSFAREYIDDNFMLRDTLRPGRLIIVDLRDEFIVKDEALGLFVIMLNIFSSVRNTNGSHFNKFIVFDEAHKYMDNKDLTGNIVTAIREMRHKGVSIMIASQDPPSLPNEIIELSSIVLLHKFNSPQWLKHIQKSITQLSLLSPADMSALNPGEGFLWSTKATEKSISTKPIKISTRPRVTKHGGSTVQASGNQ